MTNRELDQLIESRALPALPPDRLKQIENALTANLKPVRPLAAEGIYFAGFAGIFVAICIAGWYFTGQNGWLALSGFQKLAVFVPLAACIAFLVFSLVRQMTPAAMGARSSAVFSAGLFAILLLALAAIFQPARESAFVHTGLACFRTGMTYAIPAAFLFALLLLRGAALSPVLTGATAGGLAGLAGLAVLEIQCPNLNVYHIVTWHVSVTLVCVIAGLILSSVTSRRWTSNK